MRTVFGRWNPDSYACSEQSCYLGAALSFYPWGAGPNGSYELWLRLLRIYGGRWVSVVAEVHVNNGVVERNSIEVKLQNPSTFNPFGQDSDELLSGGAFSVPRFYIGSDWRGLAFHDHYLLGGGHARSMHLYHPDIYVTFDPKADPAVITRLSSFDLSCITHWSPCRKPSDLMPAAEAQYESEYPLLLRARNQHVCTPDIIRLMARDATYGGAVKITGSAQQHFLGEGTVSLPTALLVESFKPHSYWKTGEWRSLEIFDVNTDHIVAALPPQVHLGSRFIVLADSGRGYRSVRAEVCGIVPMNPQNLDVVRRGVAESLSLSEQPGGVTSQRRP